jgi:hypothetical protein
VRTVLDDVKDAPEDLRCLRTEIRLFEITVHGFKNVLGDIVDSGIPAGQTATVQLALDYSEEAVTGLLKLLNKNKQAGSRWGQIRFAFAKDKCAKHVARLERAKGYISAAISWHSPVSSPKFTEHPAPATEY